MFFFFQKVANEPKVWHLIENAEEPKVWHLIENAEEPKAWHLIENAEELFLKVDDSAAKKKKSDESLVKKQHRNGTNFREFKGAEFEELHTVVQPVNR